MEKVIAMLRNSEFSRISVSVSGKNDGLAEAIFMDHIGRKSCGLR